MEDTHEVIVAVKVQASVLLTEFDFGATIFGQKDGVANVHVDLTEGSILKGSARAFSHDDAPVELFALFGSGKNDTSLGLGLLNGLLDEDTVKEG